MHGRIPSRTLNTPPIHRQARLPGPASVTSIFANDPTAATEARITLGPCKASGPSGLYFTTLHSRRRAGLSGSWPSTSVRSKRARCGWHEQNVPLSEMGQQVSHGRKGESTKKIGLLSQLPLCRKGLRSCVGELNPGLDDRRPEAGILTTILTEPCLTMVVSSSDVMIALVSAAVLHHSGVYISDHHGILKVLLSETKAGQTIRLSARAVSAITVKASSTSLRRVICRRVAVLSHRDHYRKGSFDTYTCCKYMNRMLLFCLPVN